MEFHFLSTIIIWLFVLIFFAIACIKSHRVKILPSITIVVAITFFSLLSPAGKVLVTVHDFKITEDSLLLGLRRSGILVGMVFLSRVLISDANSSFLNRFGKIGNKLTEIFSWYNQLTEKKIEIKRGHIIDAIDQRLCEIWELD